MNDTQILKQAISAIKNGDKATGQKLLLPFLKENPKHEAALLWLSATTDDINKKRQCFERVLKINPDNEAAKRELVELQKKQANLSNVDLHSQQEKSLPQVDSTPSKPPSKITDSQGATSLEVKEQPEQMPSLPPQPPLKAIKHITTKTCPYCAETIQAKAVICRFCGKDLQETQEISETPPSSPPQDDNTGSQEISDRELILQQISKMTSKGWQVVSQTDNSVQMKKPRGWSTLLLVLGVIGIFFYGIGIIFLLLAVFDHLLRKEKVVFITAHQIRNNTLPDWSDSKLMLYLAIMLIFLCGVMWFLAQN